MVKQDKKLTSARKGTSLLMSTNFASPVKPVKTKKSTWGNFIDVYQTKVPPILIAVATRKDKPEGSYITPMVKALNDDDTGDLTKKWKILSFLSRRGLKDEGEHSGGRNAMLKRKDSPFEWEAIVAFSDETKQETPEDVGQHIARQFSAFSKNDAHVSPKIY